jgi:hypothetical protein
MRIDVVFIGTGLVVLVAGMAFGMWMGMNENFQLADAHAHLNLLGFVVPTLYGLLHHTYPSLARSRLAWPQCIAHFVGVLVFIPGLVVAIQTGNPAGAIVGATIVMLAALTFGYIFLSAPRSS